MNTLVHIIRFCARESVVHTQKEHKVSPRIYGILNNTIILQAHGIYGNYLFSKTHDNCLIMAHGKLFILKL